MQTVLPILSIHLLILNGPACLVPNAHKERRKPVVLRLEHVGRSALGVDQRDTFGVQERGVTAGEIDLASWPEAVFGLPVVHMIVNQVDAKAKCVTPMRQTRVVRVGKTPVVTREGLPADG